MVTIQKLYSPSTPSSSASESLKFINGLLSQEKEDINQREDLPRELKMAVIILKQKQVKSFTEQQWNKPENKAYKNTVEQHLKSQLNAEETQLHKDFAVLETWLKDPSLDNILKLPISNDNQTTLLLAKHNGYKITFDVFKNDYKELAQEIRKYREEQPKEVTTEAAETVKKPSTASSKTESKPFTITATHISKDDFKHLQYLNTTLAKAKTAAAINKTAFSTETKKVLLTLLQFNRPITLDDIINNENVMKVVRGLQEEVKQLNEKSKQESAKTVREISKPAPTNTGKVSINVNDKAAFDVPENQALKLANELVNISENILRAHSLPASLVDVIEDAKKAIEGKFISEISLQTLQENGVLTDAQALLLNVNRPILAEVLKSQPEALINIHTDDDFVKAQGFIQKDKQLKKSLNTLKAKYPGELNKDFLATAYKLIDNKAPDANSKVKLLTALNVKYKILSFEQSKALRSKETLNTVLSTPEPEKATATNTESFKAPKRQQVQRSGIANLFTPTKVLTAVATGIFTTAIIYGPGYLNGQEGILLGDTVSIDKLHNESTSVRADGVQYYETNKLVVPTEPTLSFIGSYTKPKVIKSIPLKNPESIKVNGKSYVIEGFAYVLTTNKAGDVIVTKLALPQGFNISDTHYSQNNSDRGLFDSRVSNVINSLKSNITIDNNLNLSVDFGLTSKTPLLTDDKGNVIPETKLEKKEETNNTPKYGRPEIEINKETGERKVVIHQTTSEQTSYNFLRFEKVDQLGLLAVLQNNKGKVLSYAMPKDVNQIYTRKANTGGAVAISQTYTYDSPGNSQINSQTEEKQTSVDPIKNMVPNGNGNFTVYLEDPDLYTFHVADISEDGEFNLMVRDEKNNLLKNEIVTAITIPNVQTVTVIQKGQPNRVFKRNVQETMKVQEENTKPKNGVYKIKTSWLSGNLYANVKGLDFNVDNYKVVTTYFDKKGRLVTLFSQINNPADVKSVVAEGWKAGIKTIRFNGTDNSEIKGEIPKSESEKQASTISVSKPVETKIVRINNGKLLKAKIIGLDFSRLTRTSITEPKTGTLNIVFGDQSGNEYEVQLNGVNKVNEIKLFGDNQSSFPSTGTLKWGKQPVPKKDIISKTEVSKSELTQKRLAYELNSLMGTVNTLNNTNIQKSNFALQANLKRFEFPKSKVIGDEVWIFDKETKSYTNFRLKLPENKQGVITIWDHDNRIKHILEYDSRTEEYKYNELLKETMSKLPSRITGNGEKNTTIPISKNEFSIFHSRNAQGQKVIVITSKVNPKHRKTIMVDESVTGVNINDDYRAAWGGN